MSAVETRDWAGVLTRHAVEPETGRRLVGQLRACEVIGARVLPPARALGARRREPARPVGGRRRSARRRPCRDGDRGSRAPLARTCSSSSPTSRRAARGTASRGRQSSSSGTTCSTRAGVHAAPHRVAPGVPRARRARSCARRARRPRHASDARPTATRCGPGCSISVRTSSTEPSRICARSLRDAAEHRGRRVGQPRPRRALRPSAPSRRDAVRRDVRSLPGRQGRQPGRRRGAARGRRDVSRAPSAVIRSPTRRWPGCARLESCCVSSSATRRPASR